MSTPTLAALAEGKLYLRAPEGELQRHESDFAQDILDRHLRMQQKDAWKGGGGDDFGSMIPRSSLWGGTAGDEAVPIAVSGVSVGEKDDSISYLLETEAVGGLLEYELSEKHERRLFHRENFRASHLDRHADHQRLVCSLGAPGGGSNLAVLDADGSNIQEATEGDSFDDAPTWVRGEEFEITFQSAGLARNRQGYVTGLGPFGIEKLNLKTGQMETLREHAETDFLQPHLDGDGMLHYIRRPYLPSGPKPPWTKTLADVLLLPVRLFRAFMHFLDAFSRLFSKKPLMTANDGPKQKGPDTNRLWVHGRLLEMEKGDASDKQGLAPSDWQLVRCSPQGEETILAKNVLAYDLAEDGTITSTDGRKIFIHREGKRQQVAELSLTEMVKWV